MSRRKPGTSKNPFHQKSSGAKPDEVIAYPIRLNKFIAKCGVCSRRKAAELVKKGLIKVNHLDVREPFIEINEDDLVEYDGKTLEPETTLVYLLLNKPKDVITTTNDERGRRTVLDLIKVKGKERLYPIGRLDRYTTGLLLLTNDGELTTKLSHPSHEVKKEYLATLDKPLASKDFEQILQGLTLEDGPAPVLGLNYHHPRHKNEIKIAISMGRNRIVRRIFEHLDYEVKALDRTYYAGLTKKGLPRNAYRHLTPREVIMLKHFS